MRCSKCESDNREDRKFCANCGASLMVSCQKCSARNRPAERFRGECGAALGTLRSTIIQAPILVTDDAASQSFSGNTLHEGECKIITALFADIKGSTELMRDIDPEQAQSILDPALRLMGEAVRRFDGYVVQSTSDGIFAIFGAPAAYEDHPRCVALPQRLEAGLQLGLAVFLPLAYSS